MNCGTAGAIDEGANMPAIRLWDEATMLLLQLLLMLTFAAVA
jgi:hypothetical protein